MVQTINDPSKKKKHGVSLQSEGQVVSGIQSQPHSFPNHFWPWKIPISQVYLYHIYIIYYNIAKKKLDYVPMNYWKTLATMGLYMEVSQVMGVPRNHHIIHVFVGIFRCSMVFFQENSYFGVPQKTMETGHGFITAVQGTRHCSPGRSQRSNDSSATAVGFGVAEVSVQRHKV